MIAGRMFENCKWRWPLDPEVELELEWGWPPASRKIPDAPADREGWRVFGESVAHRTDIEFLLRFMIQNQRGFNPPSERECWLAVKAEAERRKAAQARIFAAENIRTPVDPQHWANRNLFLAVWYNYLPDHLELGAFGVGGEKPLKGLGRPNEAVRSLKRLLKASGERPKKSKNRGKRSRK
jgi:hypothetical protein